MGKQVREDNKLDNHSDFVYPYNVSTRLLGQLIPIISIGLVHKVVISYSLSILLTDSDSIIVCDYIHLLLLLNQL